MGIGAKVLVSVARVAEKTRMDLPFVSGFSRAGDSIAGVRPKSVMAGGIGSPRASAAQACPIAAEVWMP